MLEESEIAIGKFVLFDGVPAVVVDLPGLGGVPTPEDHVALWFGDPRVVRKSAGGPGSAVPEVWTVPLDLCKYCADLIVEH